MRAPLLQSTLDALKRDCPKCGAEPGKACQQPNGHRYSGRNVHYARRSQTPAAEPLPVVSAAGSVHAYPPEGGTLTGPGRIPIPPPRARTTGDAR